MYSFHREGDSRKACHWACYLIKSLINSLNPIFLHQIVELSADVIGIGTHGRLFAVFVALPWILPEMQFVLIHFDSLAGLLE